MKQAQYPLTSQRSGPLRGRVRVPGDKSISHRALIFGLLTRGGVAIEGLLEGDDVLRTLQACRQLGAVAVRQDDHNWLVHGPGLGALLEPREGLDFANSGTGARLMMGIVGSHPIQATFDGDNSLRKRPMRRILDPLQQMGTQIVAEAEGGRCPITLRGPDLMAPLVYHTPVASAQIKSAILLAGLNARGITTLIEAQASRDHTETMLAHFGADIRVTQQGEGRRIDLVGQPELLARPIRVPADPSSAAFTIVAALLVEDSDIVVEGVMMNPLRTGLLTTLIEMGANIEIQNIRDQGEIVADLRVRASALKGVDVPAARAPSMIDEYPILAIAASFAKGHSVFRGLQELRVKESDRLAAIAAGLAAMGVKHEICGEDLRIEGGPVKGGAVVETKLDHRIAMSFLVAGLATQEPMQVDNAATIATSFPNFQSLMTSLGARFS